MTPNELLLKNTLRSITAATVKLDRDLGAIIRDAVAAREALAQGHAVAGSTLGAGPLGHQAPFDIAMTTARISALIDQALALGATGDQITAAYKVVA
jgi:hypothetical protein